MPPVLQEFFDASPLAQVLCQDGKVVMSNRSAQRLVGVDLNDEMPDWASFDAGQVEIGPRAVAYRCEDVRVAGRPCRAIAAWDATLLQRTVRARQRMSEERVARERLAAMGQMSSGVAHEFNNALQVVQISAALLQDDENAQAIRIASDRMAGMVRQMRVFSGEWDRQMAPVDALDAVKAIVAHWPVDLTVDGPLGTVDASPDDLPLVLNELLSNARRYCDAMVTVHATKHTVDDDVAHALSLAPGDYVRLSVSDDGPGMPEQTLGRAPEPFFTTDAPRRQGLGLAVVHGVAQRLGGALKISSVQGEGTTVTVWLRQARGELAVIRPTRRPLRRVLLAEDDSLVRLLLKALLQRHGLEVVACVNGAQALEHWDGSFDLVITDIVMPEMDGLQLCQALRMKHRDVPIILMTGGRSSVPQEFRDLPLLRKPFQVSELDQVLERLKPVLDA